MILLDTSVLVDSLCKPYRSLDRLQRLVSDGDQLGLASMVLYEWLRGPRKREELLDQERILPRERVIPFGPVEAAIAADLYKRVKRARGREFDLAIAATALARQAPLWTLNREDFQDIPSLQLV